MDKSGLDVKHLLKNLDLVLVICEKASNSYEVVSHLFEFYDTHGKRSEFCQFIVQSEISKIGECTEGAKEITFLKRERLFRDLFTR